MGAALLTLGIGAVAWLVFPCAMAARALLAETPSQCWTLPAPLPVIHGLAENESATRSYISKAILSVALLDGLRRRFWPVTETTWNAWLMAAHNGTEISALWCQLYPNADGDPLPVFAQKRFRRSLDQLTSRELAELVVLGRHPNLSQSQPALFDSRVNELHMAYENSKNTPTQL